ncbi:hypothetical protein PSHT_02519 [Puccinia striiformis]|uniref:Succinate dehydrogenase, cytochrome b556 subunit n=1 Tax=Puccinia striiformis TaxID=27350 RepID=A0A2S4WHN4_9BASI|nr:hypothetical protein PSHT_02519 [Puccinia striiformis]
MDRPTRNKEKPQKNHKEYRMSSSILKQTILRTQSLIPLNTVRPSILGSLSGLKQQRFNSTKTLKCSEEDALKLLNQQRKLRPSSPHFTIYEPQYRKSSNWLRFIIRFSANLSPKRSIMRNNLRVDWGFSLFFIGFYAYALGYMALPNSMPLDSETVVQFVASSPEWAKVAGKAVVALPFTYHTFNGVRHLAWDMGYLLDLKTSYTAGYTVLGLTAVSTVGLVLI